MEKVIPGLYKFEHRSEAKVHYSYLWMDKAGNILFNHIPDVSFWEDRVGALKKMGGVRWIFLTHAGDADAGSAILHREFGAELAGTKEDGEKARKKTKVPFTRLLEGGTACGKGVLAMAARGHTDAFLAFKLKSGTESCIYTSDMFHQVGEEGWKVTIPERRARIGIHSIEKIFGARCDYLLPGLSGGDASTPIDLKAGNSAGVKEAILNALRKKYKLA